MGRVREAHLMRCGWLCAVPAAWTRPVNSGCAAAECPGHHQQNSPETHGSRKIIPRYLHGWVQPLSSRCSYTAMPLGQCWPFGSAAEPPPHHLLHLFCQPSPNPRCLLARLGTEEDPGGMGFLNSAERWLGCRDGSGIFPSRGLVVGCVGWRWPVLQEAEDTQFHGCSSIIPCAIYRIWAAGSGTSSDTCWIP